MRQGKPLAVLICLFFALLLIPPGAARGQEKSNANNSATTPSNTSQSDQAAKPTTSASPEPTTRDLWTAKWFSGNWGGVRTELKDSGVNVKLVYNQQIMTNMHGGKETKNGHDFAGSYELNIELDFEKMSLVPKGSLFIRAAKGTWGGEISDFDKEKIGSLFKTNADASTEEPIYVDKWWYRQRFLDDRIEIRLGRLASKKDIIDVNKVAGSEDRMFLNAALVANPTIPHKQGLGAYINVWPTDWLYARAAIIDPMARKGRTAFDTAFHGEDRVRAYWEIGLTPKFNSQNGKLLGHYRFGSWYYPDPKDVFRNSLNGRLTPRSRSGDVGFYFGCDQLVWKENDKIKDKQGLSVFARYGYARGDVNKIEHFWSVGGQYVGPIPNHDKDVLGLGVAQGILSGQYRDEVHAKANRETVYELYYAYHLTQWCIITPDIQFITNPGGDKDDRDVFVAGLRMRFLF